MSYLTLAERPDASGARNRALPHTRCSDGAQRRKAAGLASAVSGAHAAVGHPRPTGSHGAASGSTSSGGHEIKACLRHPDSLSLSECTMMT